MIDLHTAPTPNGHRASCTLEALDNLRRWKNVMHDQPGMTKGIEVPFDLGNLLKDKEEADKFADKAQNTLQT